MNLAIATYKDEVAPCFEAAKNFQVFEIINGKVQSRRILKCYESGPIARLRLLKDAGIDILICNGIRSFYRDMLEAEDRRVCKDITGKVESALEEFVKSGMKKGKIAGKKDDTKCLFELGELVELTREYFARQGFELENDESEFPVDLIAKIKCPRCARTIRVAILCGGHLFYWEKEIMELRAVSENYDAIVYVHAAGQKVIDSCRDFNINLLDPWVLENPEKLRENKPFPILKIPIRGHEPLYAEKP